MIEFIDQRTRPPFHLDAVDSHEPDVHIQLLYCVPKQRQVLPDLLLTHLIAAEFIDLQDIPGEQSLVELLCDLGAPALGCSNIVI